MVSIVSFFTIDTHTHNSVFIVCVCVWYGCECFTIVAYFLRAAPRYLDLFTMGFPPNPLIQVTNVAPSVTTEQLRLLFSNIGPIKNIIVYPTK